MAKTKTSSAVKQRYNEKAYDRLAITIPKGRKETIDAYAKQEGISINGLVNRLLRETVGMTEEEWKDTIEAEMDKIIDDNLVALKALAED